jgi:ABC-type multidrug transport system ATPase subunit
MLELLKDLGHSKGINLIICTHLLDDVEFLADEIILINEGQIVSRKLREGLVSNRLYDVRIRGDLERFLVGMEKNSLSLAAPAEGLSLRIAIPDTLEPAIVFRVAQDTGCVVTRLEPVVETAADIVLGILRENKHANL